jgi:hypothetical protein
MNDLKGKNYTEKWEKTIEHSPWKTFSASYIVKFINVIVIDTMW